MLERTAASLESCNLQRVLPKPTRSSKRCRRLHTGFWQHGASAIELTSIWPVQTRGSQGVLEAVDPSSQPLQAGLLASTFLLDFLYPFPSGTYAYLRRLYPALTRPRSENQSFGTSRRRNFTSTAVATEVDTSAALLRCSDSVGQKSSPIRGYASGSDSSAASEIAGPATQIPTTASVSPDEPVRANGYSRNSREVCLETLTDHLSRPEDKMYSDVWDLYCRLDDDHKQGQKASVVAYLSTSQGIVDTGRAISLLRQIPMETWDEKLQTVGVLLHLQAGDEAAAIDVLNSGLKTRSCAGGFKYLVEYAITSQKWPIVLKVWLEYYSLATKAGRPISLYNNLPLLNSVPDLSKLYFSLERYLEVEAAGPVRSINLYEDTREGLQAMRRWLARQALRQPCAPRQAMRILQIWDDTNLYVGYLMRMLRRLNDGLETRASLAALPEIYQQYRTMERAKPPRLLLRGMFNFYYPADAAGLAQIYSDWHQTWGDLDLWGYVKYLNFYSTTGDVQAVKDLWARYTKLFPKASKSPLAFRSTMNVFAQLGDVAGAEHELRIMRDHYGVQPDIYIWNSLLKCYSKANDQARVFQCFEEIKKVDQPNSSTYAQVMAMAARKGDLATTLDFYNQSQKAGVQISKEMALPLVMVYCRNDRLVDAEKICTEFAQRKVTSTAVWNQLVYFNGLQGKLNTCYALLKAMKSYGVEWDHQTHEFLLRALVQANQIPAAYRFLRNARDNDIFPLGPEHFAIVMTGAVRKGQLDLAKAILSHMRSCGMTISFKAHVSLVEAAFRQNPSAPGTQTLAKDLVEHLGSMLSRNNSQTPTLSADVPPWGPPVGLGELKRQTKEIGRAIMLLVELRIFSAVERLVTGYLEVFPEFKQKNYFPPDIASALMLGYLKEGQRDQVHDLWQNTLKAVQANCTNAQGRIHPAHRYDIARPLNVVAKTYRDANDGPGLLNTVEQLTSAGFKLTSTNWNLCIQYLAEMGHWERAMDWCEEYLMPRWRGWTPGAKTPQERRDSNNTHVLVASQATVFSLQKEWLKLRKLAAWSSEVSSKLQDIERRHPMLHYAFITTDYEHLPATWALPKKKSINKAIKDMIGPLSHEELKVVRKALEKQLRVEKQRKSRRTVRSPLHVVRRSNKQGHVLTRAVKSDSENSAVVLNGEHASTREDTSRSD